MTKTVESFILVGTMVAILPPKEAILSFESAAINSAINCIKKGQPKMICKHLNSLRNLFTYSEESISEEEVFEYYEFLMALNTLESKFLAQELLAHAEMQNKENTFNLIIKLRC